MAKPALEKGVAYSKFDFGDGPECRLRLDCRFRHLAVVRACVRMKDDVATERAEEENMMYLLRW